MEQAIRCLAPIQPWPLGRSSGPVRLSGRTCGTRSHSGAAPTAGTRDHPAGQGPGACADAWGRPPARWAARGRWGRAAPWCAPPGSAATGRERKGGEEHLCEVSSPELLESRNGAWLRGMQVATEASHS